MSASLSPVKSGYPFSGYPLLNHIRIKYLLYVYISKRWMDINVIYVKEYILLTSLYEITTQNFIILIPQFYHKKPQFYHKKPHFYHKNP